MIQAITAGSRQPEIKEGDIIELIMPASGCSKSEYESCLTIIKDFGFEPRARGYEKLVDEKEVYCSNNIGYRFEHLYDALTYKASKVVWCVAGGYGSYQLLTMLDKVPAPIVQKLVIGFSDITVLLNYFVDKWGWHCIYGPTLKQIANSQVSDKAVEQVKQLILGDVRIIDVLYIRSLNKVAQVEKKITGKLLGGCLSLMQVFIGTPQNPDMTGCVLLLEDDKFETPARISRILDHMVRAGVFDKVKAVILGCFVENDTREENGLEKALDFLSRELNKRNVPLLRSPNLGHTENMISVILGADIELQLGKKPSLRIKNCQEKLIT